MNSFPTFHVSERRTDDRGAVLVGSVSAVQFGDQTWVADNYLGFLKSGDLLIAGRWRLIDDQWQFVLDKSRLRERIPETNEFQILDFYWGERAKLVLDRDIVWQSEQWLKPDDHDHCAICWATITSSENQRHFAASTGKRVCVSCHEAYVTPRALTFISSAA